MTNIRRVTTKWNAGVMRLLDTPKTGDITSAPDIYQFNFLILSYGRQIAPQKEGGKNE